MMRVDRRNAQRHRFNANLVSVAKLAPPSNPAPQGRKENSPGRKPGVRQEISAEPWKGDRKRLRTKIFRPCRGSLNATSHPGARAPGYYLSAPPGLGRHILQPSFATETNLTADAQQPCGLRFGLFGLISLELWHQVYQLFQIQPGQALHDRGQLSHDFGNIPRNPAGSGARVVPAGVDNGD